MFSAQGTEQREKPVALTAAKSEWVSDIKSSIEINRPFAPVERTKNWT